MKEGLIDLLPVERVKALRRDYWYRLGVVGMLLVSGLFLAAAALILPSYMYLSGSAKNEAARLASMKSSSASAEEKQLTQRLADLKSSAQDIIALAKRTAVSKTADALLAVPRPGVTLSGFMYTGAKGSQASTFSISGIATTRDALRSYQVALQGVSFVTTAQLPVSAYAKDTNIDFTILLTLSS